MIRFEVLIEMNQWEMAAALAEDALHNKLSKIASSGGAIDPLVPLHAILFRAGKISRPKYEATRAEWLAAHPATTPVEQQIRWLAAYGVPTYSKELAADAVSAAQNVQMPTDLYKSPLGMIWSVLYGKALMLVGKPREALPYLERVNHACLETIMVLWFVQSRALLGMAHETLGNEALACESFAKVLDRWGKAKQSVTAKAVTEHAQKLRCSPTSK
ncbi:MAG TPA: hypothetical protein PK156_23375 [Polyangium sp.]|nr:hypothetical protein [Polyangium sp.]